MARGSLVAVTYPVDGDFVQINTSVLDGLAEVAFLDGCPDAEFRDILRQADVLIGWHLGQELPAGALRADRQVAADARDRRLLAELTRGVVARDEAAPGFPAIAGTLNDLSKPSTGLRCVQPVRIGRRTFHVINLPAGKMRPIHLQVLALRIRRQDERALPCSNQ